MRIKRNSKEFHRGLYNGLLVLWVIVLFGGLPLSYFTHNIMYLFFGYPLSWLVLLIAFMVRKRYEGI